MRPTHRHVMATGISLLLSACSLEPGKIGLGEGGHEPILGDTDSKSDPATKNEDWTASNEYAPASVGDWSASFDGVTPRLNAPANIHGSASEPVGLVRLGEPTIVNVAAIGHDGNTPEQALDGDLSTRWSHEGVGSWITLDLGAAHLLEGVRIAWFRGNERQTRFSILLSADGLAFQEALAAESSGTTDAQEYYAFDIDRIARALTIRVDGNSQNDWASILEIQPVGRSLGVASALVPMGSPHLISVSASNNDGNTPERVIDGSLRTRWSALGIGSWITVQFDRPRLLAALAVGWFRGDLRQNQFRLSVTREDDSVAEVLRASSSGTTEGYEIYMLSEPTTARAVTVTVDGNTINDWASITEIRPIIREHGDGSHVDDQETLTHISHDAPEQLQLGTTTVVWTATGPDDATATQEQRIVLEGTTAADRLTVVPPPDVTVTSDSAPVQVDLARPTITGGQDPNPVVVHDAPTSGFPFGVTVVTWTVTDNAGNTVSATQTVTAIAAHVEAGVDRFGITHLYPSESAGPVWNSLHWNDGRQRVIAGDTHDPYDPTGYSLARGSGSALLSGQGTMSLSGSQPRLYINGTPEAHWVNVEATVYYRRTGTDGSAYAGLVVGARSGAEGHSRNGDYCDATTYYARLRHDGRADIVKELKHPAATARASVTLWDGNRLPSGQWIGMKFVVYNTASGDVKLEVYRDLTEGLDGGQWELVTETLDSGGWRADASGCSYPDDHIVTEGGGVVFIRNTDISEAQYKWTTVRAIDPPLDSN